MRNCLTPIEARNLLCCCSTPHRRAVVLLVLQRMKQLREKQLTESIIAGLPSIPQDLLALRSPGSDTNLNIGRPRPDIGAAQSNYADTASNYECPSCRKPTLFGQTCCGYCSSTAGTLHHHNCVHNLLPGALGPGAADFSASTSPSSVASAYPTWPPAHRTTSAAATSGSMTSSAEQVRGSCAGGGMHPCTLCGNDVTTDDFTGSICCETCLTSGGARHDPGCSADPSRTSTLHSLVYSSMRRVSPQIRGLQMKAAVPRLVVSAPAVTHEGECDSFAVGECSKK